jgi:hypothetical protein
VIRRLAEAFAVFKLTNRLKDYEPFPATYERVKSWLYQFNEDERKVLLKTVSHLVFVDKKSFISGLLEENGKLLESLRAKGVQKSNIIYVSVDSAGSSSQVTLNLLRDHGHFGRFGCHFVDSKDIEQIRVLTAKLKSGVIIYVDDFAGTGTQFSRTQQHFAQFVQGVFSHHVLFHTACPEAYDKIERIGVSVRTHKLHSKENRPLHERSSLLAIGERELLTTTCGKINRSYGLGFGSLATMVVFYRNSPNSVPLVFRGDIGQKKWCGLVPRFDDLPARTWDRSTEA